MQKYHNYTQASVPGSGDKKIDKVAVLSTDTGLSSSQNYKGMWPQNYKGMWVALAGWLCWLEHRSMHQKVMGSIPSRGVYRRQPINVSQISLSNQKKKDLCANN